MKKLIFMVWVLWSLMCVGVVAGAPVTGVQLKDNGTEIRVPAGGIIELTLPEQAGTGYSWEFNHLDQKHFKVLHADTKSLAEPNRVGGPLLRIWQIKVLAPGAANFGLDYLRPWEGRSKAVQHFAVQVCIH